MLSGRSKEVKGWQRLLEAHCRVREDSVFLAPSLDYIPTLQLTLLESWGEGCPGVRPCF